MKVFWSKLVILFIIGLFDVAHAGAQWPDFGVYHTVGTIACARAKGGSPQHIQKGSWIYAGDKLLLVDAAADIILFTRDSNYIHLKGKGSYSTHDLQTMQRTHAPDGITNRYLSLLWEELFRPGSDGETGGSTGGVSRGGSFMLSPADNYHTSLDRVLFRWLPFAWATGYHLRILYDGRRLVYDTVVKDTQLILPIRPPFEYGYTFQWSLEIQGDGGRHQLGANGNIELVDEAHVFPYPSPFPALDTALSHAQYLESIGYTHSANILYIVLVTADPSDAALQILYREFRLRNGLD